MYVYVYAYIHLHRNVIDTNRNHSFTESWYTLPRQSEQKRKYLESGQPSKRTEKIVQKVWRTGIQISRWWYTDISTSCISQIYCQHSIDPHLASPFFFRRVHTRFVKSFHCMKLHKSFVMWTEYPVVVFTPCYEKRTKIVWHSLWDSGCYSSI